MTDPQPNDPAQPPASDSPSLRPDAPTDGQPHAGQPYAGQPPHPGQPYGGQPQPGQPSAGQPYPANPPQTRGVVSWAMGFISLFFPLVGLVIGAVVMASLYPATARRGIPVATGNARSAANWGLTVLTVLVLTALYVIVLATFFPSTRQGFLPVGWSVIIVAVLSLVHLIVTIAGTVIGSSGRVFRCPIAIPYIRSRS